MRVQWIMWALIVWWPWSFVAAQQASTTQFSGIVPASEIGPYVASAAPATPGSFDEVVDRTIEREHQLVSQLSALRPMIETYVQSMKADSEDSAKTNPGPIFSAAARPCQWPGRDRFCG